MTSTNWKLCRACLNSQESFQFTLFEDVSAEQYNFCTSVEVHENDDLPRSLCRSCHELLTKFSHFKKMCIHSQNSLLQLKCENVKIEVDIPHVAYKYELYPDDDTVKEEDFSDHLHDDLLQERKSFGIKKKKKVKKRTIKKSANAKRPYKVKENGPKRHYSYSCDICSKKFVYIERYEAHKLEHEGEIAPIHCPTCNKTFRSWYGLKRHKTNEHTIVSLESLKCTICGKILKSPESLKSHMKLHENNLQHSHVCDVCGRDFRTKAVLKNHMETHKKNRERDYACEQCAKKFFSYILLNNHVSKFHTSRRYICNECNYPFTQKYNLIKHLLIHEGIKLYKCDICNKPYRTHSSLREHKRIHSGERPFPCSSCPKSFLSQRRLNDHHLTHTGERPHQCSMCHLRFAQRGTMTRHMKVHEKSIPV